MTTLAKKTGYQQINKKADQALVRIDQQRRTLEQQISEDQAALLQIHAQADNRNGVLAHVRRTLATLQAEQDQARNYAGLAQGTLAELEAIERLHHAEKLFQDQQRAHAQLERESTEQDQAEREQVTALQARIDQARRTLEQDQAERERIEDGKRQAIAFLGESTYQDIEQQVQALQARIEEKRKALITEQLALTRYLESEALPQLQHWPELQQKLKALLPAPENATTRTLQAGLTYMRELLRNGAQLAALGSLPVASSYYNWLALLAIPDSELYVEETLRGNPRMLRRREQLVSKLLEQYRATIQ